ncbi:TPA: hypothetical protein ACH3X1_016184 [Trebouxia sp. C0004]
MRMPLQIQRRRLHYIDGVLDQKDVIHHRSIHCNTCRGLNQQWTSSFQIANPATYDIFQTDFAYSKQILQSALDSIDSNCRAHQAPSASSSSGCTAVMRTVNWH